LEGVVVLKNVVCIGLLCISYTSITNAQAVSSADVNIVSLQAQVAKENRFVCTAVINNQNDDDSRGTKVIVLMPLQVKITKMSVLGGAGQCQKGATLGGFDGYAICDLGHLPQGQTVRRTVEITSTKSSAGPNYPQTCSAFIYSLVGDIKKDNNYAVATAP
jgi:hypothetical protein